MNFEPSDPNPQTLRARWVIPVEGPPIADGVVVTHQGKIVAVRPTAGGDQGECEDVAILPAFVNAHTHLEFSSLAQPIGDRGLPFTEWIRQVIAWRRERDSVEANGAKLSRAAIAAGIVESIRGGAGCVGEIATSETSLDELLQSELAGVAFWELIGLSPSRVVPLADQAGYFVRSSFTGDPLVRPGISPHAPYTVHPELLLEVVHLSAEKRVPVAMHVAETREELQLLRDRSGPFVDLLTELNAWSPEAIRTNSRPLDYLQLLAQAHRALVIHGNYLDPEEQDFAANHRDQLTIVYCPRTHSFFDHAAYPLRHLLDCGARVALGTDSRASNPDLNMLAELRFAANKHADIAPDALIRMATIDAAYALGLEDQLGSLKLGKQSRVQKVRLTGDSRRDPYGWLYRHDGDFSAFPVPLR
jgi:cytosine/adenosine deaminase-related metal-dependent hydrolase